MFKTPGFEVCPSIVTKSLLILSRLLMISKHRFDVEPVERHRYTAHGASLPADRGSLPIPTFVRSLWTKRSFCPHLVIAPATIALHKPRMREVIIDSSWYHVFNSVCVGLDQSDKQISYSGRQQFVFGVSEHRLPNLWLANLNSVKVRFGANFVFRMANRYRVNRLADHQPSSNQPITRNTRWISSPHQKRNVVSREYFGIGLVFFVSFEWLWMTTNSLRISPKHSWRDISDIVTIHSIVWLLPSPSDSMICAVWKCWSFCISYFSRKLGFTYYINRKRKLETVIFRFHPAKSCLQNQISHWFAKHLRGLPIRSLSLCVSTLNLNWHDCNL